MVVGGLKCNGSPVLDRLSGAAAVLSIKPTSELIYFYLCDCIVVCCPDRRNPSSVGFRLELDNWDLLGLGFILSCISFDTDPTGIL